MSKVHDIQLAEVRIHSHFLHDALSAILHTILFVRAPNIVKATDQVCKHLHPLTFAKCGPADVDQTINETIEIFKKSLYQIGPGRHFRGEIGLSFYDVKEIKEYFGMVTRNQNVYFESNQRELLSNAGYMWGNIADLNQTEQASAYHSAYEQTTRAITTIIEAVNAQSDHIPLTLYDYEVQVVTPPMSGSNYGSGQNSANASPASGAGATGGGGSGRQQPAIVHKLLNTQGFL